MPRISFVRGDSPFTRHEIGVMEKTDDITFLRPEPRQFLVNQEVIDEVERFRFDEITGAELWDFFIENAPQVDEFFMSDAWLLLSVPTAAERKARIKARSQKPSKKTKKPKKPTKVQVRKKKRAAEKRRKARQRRQKIRELNPNPQPTKIWQVELNDSEGNCGGNILNDPEYSGTHVYEFINRLNQQKNNIMLMDRLGLCIECRISSNKQLISCLVDHNHVYPFKGLIMRQHKQDKQEGDLIQFEEGVTLPETLEMMDMIKPLMYNGKESSGYGIDMNEAYLTVSLIEENYGVPCISDFPQPYKGQKIFDWNLYVIRPDDNVVKKLIKCGRTTNVMSGMSYKLLKSKIPEMKIIIVLKYENVKIWDTKSGKCLKTLKGHSEAVESLTILSNGILASGSEYATIKIWGDPKF